MSDTANTPKRTNKEAWTALDALPVAEARIQELEAKLTASEAQRVELANRLNEASAAIDRMKQDLSIITTQFEAEMKKGFFARLFGFS